MPLRIDGELIKEARVSGHLFHRSIAQQVEHWATLGKVFETVLSIKSVAKVKRLSDPINLDRILAQASSTAGKKRTLALLAKKKGPLYGIDPAKPGILLQYQADGTALPVKKGKFVQAGKTAKAKSSTVR